MWHFNRVVGFQWDAENARKSADTHGVQQTEAEQVFFNEALLVVEDASYSGPESRFHALGVTDRGRRLLVSFTLRESDTQIRIISARDTSRKEPPYHEQET